MGSKARITVLIFLGLLALCGCTDRDVESLENGLWQMFEGHPKPKLLKADPPPVYCYPTLGEPDCYAQPLRPESG